MIPIKRIALLTDGIFPLVIGGMQKHSYFLLKHLLEKDIHVLLYHPGGKGKLKEHLAVQLWPFLEERIITFPSKGILPGSYLRRSFTYARRIAEDLKKSAEVDFIYAQGFAGWAMIDEKKKGRKTAPIGVNFHGLEMFQEAKGLKQKLIQRYFQGPVRFQIEHADLVYSLGSRLSDLIKKEVPTAQIAEIPIGLDASWANAQRESVSFAQETKKLVFVGRQEYRKGLHILFEILKENHFADLEIHFIGAVNRPIGLEKRKLHFHGEFRDEGQVKVILDKCHALIAPSLAEGMPTVIMEAMARGLPIIASDVGAVNEQVNAENGILMRPGDKEALSQALLTFMSWSNDEWRSKSAASRTRFLEQFTWEKVIVRTLRDMQERTS